MNLSNRKNYGVIDRNEAVRKRSLGRGVGRKEDR